jgi:hypothetical protein
MRAEHRDNETGIRDDGHEVDKGWRSEAVGVYESAGQIPIRYEWSTMLDPSYPRDPHVVVGGGAPGPPAWQVITQWHQGDHDRGGSPPIAITIVGDEIMLDLHRHDPAAAAASIQRGQWKLANVDRGNWHQFTAEIVWDIGHGSIRLWHNGVPVVFSPQYPPSSPGEPQFPQQATELLTGLETLFPAQQAGGSPEAYLKAGIYRKAAPTDPPGPYVVHHDEFARYEPVIRTLPPLPWPLVIQWPPWLPKIPRPFPWPFPWPPWPPPRPPWPPFRRRRAGHTQPPA